jgi:DNA-directed RNA polymerase subunit RPC12/RpoP
MSKIQDIINVQFFSENGIDKMYCVFCERAFEVNFKEVWRQEYTRITCPHCNESFVIKNPAYRSISIRSDSICLLCEIAFMISLGTGLAIAGGFSFLPAFGIAWLSFAVFLLIEGLALKCSRKKKGGKNGEK